MKSRFLSILEWVLLVLGIGLLMVYGAATLDRNTSSRMALRAFQQSAALGSGYSQNKNPVDYSLWSEHRLEEYQKALLLTPDTTLGTLRIGRLNLYVPVFAGADELSLNRGVGWIPGTAMPGHTGNIGIAGHRDGFFRVLKNIARGDRIELSTLANTISYDVDQIEIVNPEDVSVLKPRREPSLTLVTCFPFYFLGSAPKRFVVHARFLRPATQTALTELLPSTPFSLLESKEREK